MDLYPQRRYGCCMEVASSRNTDSFLPEYTRCKMVKFHGFFYNHLSWNSSSLAKLSKFRRCFSLFCKFNVFRPHIL